MSQVVRIAPSFARTFRFFLAIFAAIVIVTGLIELLTGTPPSRIASKLTSQDAMSAIWFLAAVGAIGAVILTSIGRFLAIDITADEISGRTENGRRLVIPTDSVSEISYRPNPYAPGLFLSSTRSDSKIFTVMIGVDLVRAKEEVCAAFGPSHPLCRWLEKNAT